MKKIPIVAAILTLTTSCTKPLPSTYLPSEIKQDGTVVINSRSVPISSILSPEAHEFMRSIIVDKRFGKSVPGLTEERARQDEIMYGFLRPMRERYDVTIEEKEIGGIFTQIITPTSGIKDENKSRVLLNLHGGGFVTGGRSASLVESVPLAALMGIKVISIDYRMGPEYQFPAASEDVATVYGEILKTYKPENVGLFGCSAGGILTAQSVAWFDKQGMPQPGGIGVFCATLGKFFVGDVASLSGPLNGIVSTIPKGKTDGRPSTPRRRSYLGNAQPNAPLAYPLTSTKLLESFPPTLFITATRAFEFSSALNSHNALEKAGVKTKFHGWDGLNHAFFYNSEIPESREAYNIMVDFFDENLGKH